MTLGLIHQKRAGMSRKLRIETLGYHHVYNRGVAKSNVFLDEHDKVKFIELLANVAREYKFNIHSFCLMDNHYHLLIENRRENLSLGMRQLNARYARYFNKRHSRVGHLWQDRYKSWYVLDEKHLFTLFRYIENNPVKAKISEKIGEYKYCATYSIFKDAIPPFLENTFVLRDYPMHELLERLTFSFNEVEKQTIDSLHQSKYKCEGNVVSALHGEKLENYFLHVRTKHERNLAMKKAFADGYTKSQIARNTFLSVAGVSKILKS